MAGGRPPVIDKACLNKLEEAFSLGCTDLEACFYANISSQTLYNYQKNNPEFLERKEALKEQPVLKARKVVVDAIDSGDKQTSQWYLERKNKAEFSTRSDLKLSGEVKAEITVNSNIPCAPNDGN